jgi:hypothetical protein
MSGAPIADSSGALPAGKRHPTIVPAGLPAAQPAGDHPKMQIHKPDTECVALAEISMALDEFSELSLYVSPLHALTNLILEVFTLHGDREQIAVLFGNEVK